ncbi:MAG: hypothetical protein A3B68_03700 [Candidatus Melainabacteria bacterium RIFCSPHIGHO2_02_FULL_34_12]|nr:MAG: hypothetical protein A3B68_03700 [Candidatus Melainabacteria bacterium RIFCSPHIGHO2_02_FULL_34_12]
MTDIRHVNSIRPGSDNKSGNNSDSGSSVDTKNVSEQLAALNQSRESMRGTLDETNQKSNAVNNNISNAQKSISDSNNQQTEYALQEQSASTSFYDAQRTAGRLRGEANELRALAKKNPKLKDSFMSQAARKDALAVVEDQKAQKALADQHEARMNQNDAQKLAEDSTQIKNESIRQQNQLTQQTGDLNRQINETSSSSKNLESNSGSTSADADANASSNSNSQNNTQSQNTNLNSNNTTQTQNVTLGSASATANNSSNTNTASGNGNATLGKTQSGTGTGTGTTPAVNRTSTTSSNTSSSSAALGSASVNPSNSSVLSGAASASGPTAALGAAFGGAGGGYLSAAYGAIEQIAQLNRQPVSPHPTAQVAKWTSIQSIAERGVAYIEAAILDQTLTGTPLHQFAILLKTVLNTVLGEARGNVEGHTKTIEEYKKAEKDTQQLALRA